MSTEAYLVAFGPSLSSSQWLALESRFFIVVLCTGDFPDVDRYRQILSAYDLAALPKLKEKDIKNIEEALTVDIPTLVRQFDNPYS